MDLLEDAKKIAKSILAEGKASGVLGLVKAIDGIAPHVFETSEDMELLVIEPKWLLAKLTMNILKSSPDDYRLGLICRGCDERAIVELRKRNQIDGERLTIIGLACNQEQARACLCKRPYPSKVDIGEAVDGVDPFEVERTKEFIGGDEKARMEKWARELKRCIKCYGCRNACPICVCVPCKLEDDLWVSRGRMPAEISFHLIRAFHLADTCVACGACQDACPVNIPLMLLQLSMRDVLMKNYGYEAGTDSERLSPLLSDLFREPSPKYEVPGWMDSMSVKNES